MGADVIDTERAHDARASARRPVRTIINRGLLLGLVLVALDSLAVAHFQVESALALIRYTPPLTLLVGVMLNLGPLVAAYLIAVLLVAFVSWAADGNIEGAVAAGFGAAATFWVSNALFDSRYTWSPTRMVLWSGVAVVAAFVLRGLVNRGHVDEGTPYSVLFLGTTMALVSFVVDPALRRSVVTPYLPPERVEVVGRDAGTLVGYVLDVDQSGQWTTILAEESRQVLVMSSRDVSSRTVCTLDADANGSPRWPIVPPTDSELARCQNSSAVAGE